MKSIHPQALTHLLILFLFLFLFLFLISRKSGDQEAIPTKRREKRRLEIFIVKESFRLLETYIHEFIQKI